MDLTREKSNLNYNSDKQKRSKRKHSNDKKSEKRKKDSRQKTSLFAGKSKLEAHTNSPKITSYFTPIVKISTKSKNINSSSSNMELKKVVIENGKENFCCDLSKKSDCSFFKKYGVHVPSYRDILRDKKNCEEYDEMLKKLKTLATPLPDIEKFHLENEASQVIALNCKHLSLEKISAAFENNVEYLSDIFHGRSFCKRHEMFKNAILRRTLILNTSMILFTNEQKQFLASLLCQTYGNSMSLSEYYFKVLLPELCLKIFIDEFSMTYEDATKYLDDYPLEM